MQGDKCGLIGTAADKDIPGANLISGRGKSNCSVSDRVTSDWSGTLGRLNVVRQHYVFTICVVLHTMPSYLLSASQV
jgi:hypothetical protein